MTKTTERRSKGTEKKEQREERKKDRPARGGNARVNEGGEENTEAKATR